MLNPSALNKTIFLQRSKLQSVLETSESKQLPLKLQNAWQRVKLRVRAASRTIIGAGVSACSGLHPLQSRGNHR